MLSSSGLSGSLGSGTAGSGGVGGQYSSAFPVSSFTHPTHQAYSGKQRDQQRDQQREPQRDQQLTSGTLKQHRNSSVGLYKPTGQEASQTQQRTAGERSVQQQQQQQAKAAGSDRSSQQTGNMASSQAANQSHHSASPIPPASSAMYQPSGKYQPQQQQQHKQPINQVNQNNFGAMGNKMAGQMNPNQMTQVQMSQSQINQNQMNQNQMNQNQMNQIGAGQMNQLNQSQINQSQYQSQSTNPFTSNYQPQMVNAQQPQYSMGANLQSNLQGNMQMSAGMQQPYYNQPPQQQQYMPQQPHQTQLMAPNQLHTQHISPNISPHISPKHHGLRSASTGDALNLANCQQQPLQSVLQPISNQRQLLAFQQQQQQQQNALQNQQPGAPVQVNLMLPPLFQQNKIAQFFYVYQSTGRSGPQLAWSIFSAIRKCDLKPGMLLFFLVLFFSFLVLLSALHSP